MKVLYFLTVVQFGIKISTSNSVSTVSTDSTDTCVYNNVIYASGNVIESLPNKCLQLICENGITKHKSFYGNNTCQCCEHDNKLYEEGSVLGGTCGRLYCECGKWVPTEYVHDCCSDCVLFGNVFISTFDTPEFYQLSWFCPESLIQTLMEYDSENIIYGTFKPCDTSLCLASINLWFGTDHLDIALDNVGVVLINDIWNVLISNQPQHLQLFSGKKNILAWMVNPMCVRILGPHSILIEICENDVRILVHPSLSGKVEGLCGHYDLYAQNDFTGRDGTIHPPAFHPDKPDVEFLESWKVSNSYQPSSCYQSFSRFEPLNCVGSSEIVMMCNMAIANAVQYLQLKGVLYPPSQSEINQIKDMCVASACNAPQPVNGTSLLDSHYTQNMINFLAIKSQQIGEHQVISVAPNFSQCTLT